MTCCMLDSGCSIIERMMYFSSCRDLIPLSGVYSPSCRLGVISSYLGKDACSLRRGAALNPRPEKAAGV